MATTPEPEEKWTEGKILALLQAKYSPGDRMAPEWVTFSQVRSHPTKNVRTIDFWAMNCWSSGGFRTLVVEVKVSRSDWLREINDIEKRQEWKGLVHQFYYCAPNKVIKPEEVPEGYGLMVPAGANGLRTAVQPKMDENVSITLPFLAIIARRAVEGSAEERRKLNELADYRGKTISYDDLYKLAFKVFKFREQRELERQVEAKFWNKTQQERKDGLAWKTKEGHLLREILAAFGESYYSIDHNKETLLAKLRKAAAAREIPDLAFRLREMADKLEGKGVDGRS